MKFGISGRSLLDSLTGIGRYTYELLGAMANAAPEDEFELFSFCFRDARQRFSAMPLPKATNIRKRVLSFPVPILLRLWERNWVPLQGWNLFHSTDHIVPTLKQGTKLVATVHDLSMFSDDSWHLNQNRLYFQRQIEKIVDKADVIITASDFTSQCLREVFPNCQKCIHTIYQGWHPLPTNSLNFLPPCPRPYFFFLGTVEPRKNISRLLEAYQLLRERYRDIDPLLVIAGKWGWNYEKTKEIYEKSPFREDIQFLDYVSQEDIARYFRHAIAFVYPSLYEGFGRPPLEAMGHGCPVITSQAASLPEVVGKAGLLINPSEVEDLAEAMIKMAQIGEDERDQWIAKGQEQAKRFSWANAAAETLALYRGAL